VPPPPPPPRARGESGKVFTALPSPTAAGNDQVSGFYRKGGPIVGVGSWKGRRPSSPALVDAWHGVSGAIWLGMPRGGKLNCLNQQFSSFGVGPDWITWIKLALGPSKIWHAPGDQRRGAGQCPGRMS